MADGSVLENSNSNANSTIYLYTCGTSEPPNVGEVFFTGETNPSTSVLLVNCLTRTETDIYAFLSLITQSSVIYV